MKRPNEAMTVEFLLYILREFKRQSRLHTNTPPDLDTFAEHEWMKVIIRDRVEKLGQFDAFPKYIKNRSYRKQCMEQRIRFINKWVAVLKMKKTTSKAKAAREQAAKHSQMLAEMGKGSRFSM